MENQGRNETLEKILKVLLTFVQGKVSYGMPVKKNLLWTGITAFIDPLELFVLLINEYRKLQVECGRKDAKILEWENFWAERKLSFESQTNAINVLQARIDVKDKEISGLNEKIETLEEKPVPLLPPAEIKPTTLSFSPSDLQWVEYIPHPSVIGILGRRGSGKTAAGFKLLELLKFKLKAWVFGFPQDKRKIMPDYIGFVDSLEDLQKIPENSVVLLDEAHLHFHSRRSQNEAVLIIGSILNLSRQRGLTLIFIMQESRQVDKNIINGINALIIRELGMYQIKFDRPELRDVLKEAKNKLESLPKARKKKTAYLYSPDCAFSGLIEISLPTFWSDELSRAYGQATNHEVKGNMQFPRAMPKKEQIARVKELKNKGYSYGEIARMIGLKKTTVHRYATKH